MILTYNLSTLVPYINWLYFFHAWQTPSADRQLMLRQEAEQTLKELDKHYHTHALFGIFPAYSDGDDIVVETEQGAKHSERLPMLRQQQAGSAHLCLADFISPLPPQRSPHSSHTSAIGLFATSVDHGLETDFNADPYQKMMVQLLADRLAEATAERLHEEVRTRYWGYAPDERLTIDELHAEHFQGIRPAIGYPSLPDTSLNFVLNQLLDFSQIGIRLIESGAMRPHASVSGLMMSHPRARYFSVGTIGSDQLSDYARRRGLPIALMRRFLAANI